MIASARSLDRGDNVAVRKGRSAMAAQISRQGIAARPSAVSARPDRAGLRRDHRQGWSGERGAPSADSPTVHIDRQTRPRRITLGDGGRALESDGPVALAPYTGSAHQQGAIRDSVWSAYDRAGRVPRCRARSRCSGNRVPIGPRVTSLCTPGLVRQRNHGSKGIRQQPTRSEAAAASAPRLSATGLAPH